MANNECKKTIILWPDLIKFHTPTKMVRDIYERLKCWLVCMQCVTREIFRIVDKVLFFCGNNEMKKDLSRQVASVASFAHLTSLWTALAAFLS